MRHCRHGVYAPALLIASYYLQCGEIIFYLFKINIKSSFINLIIDLIGFTELAAFCIQNKKDNFIFKWSYLHNTHNIY